MVKDNKIICVFHGYTKNTDTNSEIVAISYSNTHISKTVSFAISMSTLHKIPAKTTLIKDIIIILYYMIKL